MNNFNWIDWHINKETAYIIENYPYWFKLKTIMYVWLETNKNWVRLVTQTINPKNWKENAPKKTTYSTYKRLYLDDTWHIKNYSYDLYSIEWFIKAKSIWLFLNKDLEKELEEAQRIMSIRWLVVYCGYDLNKIKDFTILDLEELDRKEKEKDLDYINQFKSEEWKDPNYSPFKVTTYTIW
jgi:hypothetical protein